MNLGNWLYSLAPSPGWLLVAILVIALTESLAVVGLVIPGVVLMTAAASLAGHYDLSIPLILGFAFVGAVIGDGISFLLFDMASPGVTVSPIQLISGSSPFCQTFFENVKVPKDQIVGEVNRGWDVAKYLLGHEREMISGTGGGDRAGSLGAALVDTVGKDDSGRLDDPMLRAELARFDVDALAFTAMSERFVDEMKAGKGHPAQPNMLKYAGTELNKRRHALIMEAGGSDALEWESERSSEGVRPRAWLRTKANSIEGGTSEIMLNVVAKRILELPGA